MLEAGPFADIGKIFGVGGVLLEVLHGDQIAGMSHAGLPRERRAHDHFGRYQRRDAHAGRPWQIDLRGELGRHTPSLFVGFVWRVIQQLGFAPTATLCYRNLLERPATPTH